jgi:hypothetical protein
MGFLKKRVIFLIILSLNDTVLNLKNKIVNPSPI